MASQLGLLEIVRLFREPRSQPGMWPTPVIVRYPLPENLPKMSLVQRNEEIQALPPDCSDQPFAIRICLRRPQRCFQDLQPQRFQGSILLSRENAVPVVDEEALWLLARNDFSKLLKRPGCRGICRDVAMGDPACTDLHNY